jgi:acyl-CoA-binding protein
MDLEDQFESCASKLRNKSTPTSEEDLLMLYGLYHQIKNGNCNTPQPWKVQKDYYLRWEAWNKCYNMDRNIAMQKYIEKVNEIMEN